MRRIVRHVDITDIVRHELLLSWQIYFRNSCYQNNLAAGAGQILLLAGQFWTEFTKTWIRKDWKYGHLGKKGGGGEHVLFEMFWEKKRKTFKINEYMFYTFSCWKYYAIQKFAVGKCFVCLFVCWFKKYIYFYLAMTLNCLKVTLRLIGKILV